MNKYILILSAFLFTAAKAQNTYSTELGRTGGRPIFYNTTPAPGGGFLLSGYSSTTSFDSSMALIARVDSALNFEWCKRVRFYKGGDFYSITPLQNGGYWLGGTGREDFVSIKGATAVKINADGDVLSARLYSDSYDDRTLAIFENPDNSLMVFVRKGVSGEPTKMLKADAGANILSSYKLARGSNNLLADAITTDNQGHYYMAGTIPGAGISQVTYITKLNATGAEWYKEYEFGRAVQSATGLALLTDGAIGATILLRDSANSSYNFFAMKLDTAGNVTWKRELDGGQLEASHTISATADGGMIITGAITSAPYVMMVKLTGAGNVVWSKRYSALNGGYPVKVNELPDGRLLVLASDIAVPNTALLILNANGDAACSNNLTLTATSPVITVTAAALTTTVPNVTGYLWEPDTVSVNLNQLAGCADATGIEDIKERLQVNVYPNPASTSFTLDIAQPVPTNAFFRLCDITGREVIAETITRAVNKVSTIGFGKGLYFWQVIADNNVVSKGKVVLQ